MDRSRMQRPILGGTPPARPIRPGQPAAQAQPSLLRPPTISIGNMEFRPAAPAAAPQPHAVQPVATPHHTPVFKPAPQQPVASRPIAPQPPAAQSIFRQPAAPAAQPAPAPAQPALRPSAFVPAEPAATTTPPTAQTSHVHDPVRTAAEPAKQHHGAHATGHAGLIGFATFIVFGVVFLAPFVPGKIWDGAPGSSQSFSTGDQNIDCVGTVGKITNTLSYDSKAGFPLVYGYATTSTISASCGGKVQAATGGHTSQFNPLALLIDFGLALTISITAARLWRRFRSHRD